MSENEKPATVMIARDGMTLPIGSEGYLKTWNGLKYTLNVGVLKTLAFPIALTIGAAFYFSGRSISLDTRGQAMVSPGMGPSLPILNSKILVEQDLINVIRKKPIDLSPMGRIQVFSLGTLTAIPAGTEAQANLVSGASNGIVKAQLVTPMLVDNEPVIPVGSTIFGHGKSTEDRLFIEFNRANFPDGESIPIRAQAFDFSDKILGLKGALVGAKTKKMALGMLFGFMGGAADGLQDTNGSIFELGQRPSVRDAALSGTAKATLDQSQMYLDQVKHAPEIIEVKQGTDFYLIVDEPKPGKDEVKE